MIFPDRSQFDAMAAKGERVPVYAELYADLETPLSAYWKLCEGAVNSFLFESVTGGERLARYSLLGANPRELLLKRGRKLLRHRDGAWSEEDLPTGDDGLAALEAMVGSAEVRSLPGLPTFVGGAVGMFTYDMVREFEELGEGPPDVLGLPDYAWMAADEVVVFDHAQNVIRVICLTDAEGYERATARIETLVSKLKSPLPSLPKGQFPVEVPTSNMTREAYEAAVAKVIDYVAAGDGQQMVPSQRFSVPCAAHPISVYRALRRINPSPYMFVLRYEGFDLVGASPELMVSLREGVATVRPIAGTRPRGKTPEEDQSLAGELLADEKERAEHVMLVDLGRNDLGRVCEIGQVEVKDLMVIERYSHVMHIVSEVEGRLAAGKSTMDLIRATFPAGTVSGAPKVRAMQIIDEVEPSRRGIYAGAVGFISVTGDFDSCIAIRTILLKDGVAHVQAGAGVVYDSVPAKEYEETRNKARASLRAIEIACQGIE
jgi:anthranilate synthase component 1